MKLRADQGPNSYEEQKSYPEEKEQKHRVPPFTSLLHLIFSYRKTKSSSGLAFSSS